MPIKRDLSAYFADIKNAAEPVASTRKSYKVENAFVPTYKDGKFSVVIRFLPSHPEEFKPFVENRTHMFRVNGDQWFGCDCLGKFGKPCPICEYNRKQFQIYTNKEEAKQHSFGRARSRYVCNIMVVRNPNNPEQEGHVYRFEFGTQIMKFISEAMTDKDDGIEIRKGINPFDWFAGANFVYEGVTSPNGPKLNASHFGPQQPINRWTGTKYEALTEAEIDAVESKLYRLDECYHKEEDVSDYNAILERYAKKTGKTLFDGLPVTGTATAAASIASTNPFAATPSPQPATPAETLDFTAPVAPEPVKVSPPPAETLDDAAFWATVNG